MAHRAISRMLLIGMVLLCAAVAPARSQAGEDPAEDPPTPPPSGSNEIERDLAPSDGTLPLPEHLRFGDARPMPMPLVGPRTERPSGAIGRLVTKDLVTGKITERAAVGLEELVGHRYTEAGIGIEEILEHPDAVAKNFGSWTLVDDPTAGVYPRRVKMFMQFTDVQGFLVNYLCSGTLIDPMHVITAAHCIYSWDDPETSISIFDWADEVIVSPGFENDTSPFGVARAVQLHAWSNWTSDRDYDHDVAFFDLDRPIGALTGWTGFGANSAESWYSEGSWTHIGYPAQAPFDGQLLYQNVGTFDEVPVYGWDYRLGFLAPSWGGSSGSSATRDEVAYAVLSGSNRVDHTEDVRLTGVKFDQILGELLADRPDPLDLVAMDVHTDATAIAGQSISGYDFAVHNYSESAANGAWFYTVYLSTDDVITSSDRYLYDSSFVFDFQPMSTVRVVGPPIVIPPDIATGTYRLGILLTHTDFNAANNGSHGREVAFLRVECPGSPVPTLQAPPNGLLCANDELTFDWTDIGLGSQYQLQIGTSCGAGVILDVEGSQYTHAGLQPGTDYYWRVRGRNLCGGWGEWSTCRWLQTRPDLGVTWQLVSPGDGNACVPLQATFTWTEVPYAERYQIRIGTGCGLGTGHTTLTNSYTTTLLPDQTYYWQVQVRTLCGDWTDWSECFSLHTTVATVATPGLVLPTDGTPCARPSPVLKWASVPNAASYEVQIGTSCGTGTILTSPVATLIAGPLLADEVYEWRVRALHACGVASEWSPCWSFTVDATPPTTPTGLASTSHVASTWSADRTIDVSWNASVDDCSPTQYSFVWDTAPFTLPDLVSESRVTSTTSPALADHAGYYFHLRALDLAENSAPGVLHLGPFPIDATPPVAPIIVHTTVPVNSPGAHPLVEIDWTASSDLTSGLAGFSFALDTMALGHPDLVVDSEATTAGLAFPGTASWYFHLWALDRAGNVSSIAHFGPMVVNPLLIGVRLTDPGRGARLVSGATFPVHWDLTIPAGGMVQSGQLLFSPDGGLSYQSIASLSAVQVLSHTYDWAVPSLQSDVVYLLMRVDDPAGGRYYSMTPRFTIATPTGAPEVPADLRLAIVGNHPNPFNPRTTIDYTIVAAGDVRLEVYDVLGRHVRTLVGAWLDAPGSYSAEWDGLDHDGRPVASGVYLLKLEATGSSDTHRMVLVR